MMFGALIFVLIGLVGWVAFDFFQQWTIALACWGVCFNLWLIAARR